MSKVLIDLVEESFTNVECRKVIRSAVAILETSEAFKTGRLDRDVIEELKKYYQNIALTELLLLWHDAYNSFMIGHKSKKEDNETSYLVRHKMIALGMIINDNY